jgi:hypothetical protein
VNGPATDSINKNDLMIVECAAHLAVAATFLVTAEYSPIHWNPADMAIHCVNEACRDGKLGFMHRSLLGKLR